ncbi:hypothetical protein SAMN05216364_10785, partial [Porphyromonadaceae bacterium KHP3R9]
YLFRRKLVEYAREHGEDLFKKCQRALFGQKLPQDIANLCFNMYIIVNIFLVNKSNHIFPAKLRFSVI